jgi:hypothetical protein
MTVKRKAKSMVPRDGRGEGRELSCPVVVVVVPSHATSPRRWSALSCELRAALSLRESRRGRAGPTTRPHATACPDPVTAIPHLRERHLQP